MVGATEAESPKTLRNSAGHGWTERLQRVKQLVRTTCCLVPLIETHFKAPFYIHIGMYMHFVYMKGRHELVGNIRTESRRNNK